MNISYRELASHEAERIGELVISNFIKRAWRNVNGVMQWVEINWWDKNLPDGYENHLAALKEVFEEGGFVVGAFDGEKLIGFCCIYREIFGDLYKYVLLDQLFISTEYQRKGIGKKLFFMCVEQAKIRGADKFYICSGSAEETLAFYIALGCEEVKEINPEINEECENDIQLEYDFKTMPLPIKTQRLYITKFYETMAESVRANSLDEDNRRFVPDEVFETIDEAREVISAIVSFYSDDEAPQIYAVHLKNGQHIGHVQAVPIPDGWEAGFHIAKPFTGKGYAAEAIKAFLPEIMKRLDIPEIFGITHTDNIASRRVLEKCGFTRLHEEPEQEKIIFIYKTDVLAESLCSQ